MLMHSKVLAHHIQPPFKVKFHCCTGNTCWEWPCGWGACALSAMPVAAAAAAAVPVAAAAAAAALGSTSAISGLISFDRTPTACNVTTQHGITHYDGRWRLSAVTLFRGESQVVKTCFATAELALPLQIWEAYAAITHQGLALVMMPAPLLSTCQGTDEHQDQQQAQQVTHGCGVLLSAVQCVCV
jgi:hypothetical protein